MKPQVRRERSVFEGGRRFLLSGEMHYFRVEPELWPRILGRVRQSHMDSVSVYVPWNWHEPTPGAFDLAGETHPRRNLVRFLDLCIAAGLAIHLRPGPWIQAEWRNGGPPDWLFRDHPEVLALDSIGRPSDPDILVPPVTYVHPVLLEHVSRWFRAIAPLVRERSDWIVAIQLDDELHYGSGVRANDPLLVDYNPVVVGAEGRPGFYQTWLAERYADIDRLNDAYGARFSSFDEVQPPRRRPASFQELPWFHDWHYCKETMADRYVEHLRDVLVGEGIENRLTMLMPYMTPYGCARFSDHFRGRGKPILVTTQSYAALWTSGVFSASAAGHVAASVQTARGWNAPAEPLLSVETQAAFGFHLTAEAMEPFYALMVAQGLSGMSFYMMVGGDNPSPWGMSTGGSYDLGAAIGHDGSERPHLAAIDRIGQFLDTHGEAILGTEPLLDLAVGYYPPYETAAQQGNTLDYGARHEYGEVLGQVFGLAPTARAHEAGVLSLLTAAGYTYAMIDLERATPAQLASFRQVWCLGLDFMAREVQAKLLAYVEAGGHLVLLPQVPHLGKDMRPEDLLARRIGARVVDPRVSALVGPHRVSWHLVRFGSASGLPVSDIVDTFDLSALPGAEPLATDERTGAVCGYGVRVGAGSATVLGFKPRFGWDSHGTHRNFIHAITARAGVAPCARVEGSELLVVERSSSERAFLFVINPTTWPQRGRITYRHPGTGASASIPRLIDAVELPTQGALILLVNAPIPGTEAWLVHTTSQIQSWTSSGPMFELELYGPAGTLGETSLRLPRATSVTIDDAPPLQQAQDGPDTLVVYRHAARPVRLRVQL